MRIKIKIGGKTLAATLEDNATSRDFVSLLPLTLTMNDLFEREKFGHLPKSVSHEGKRAFTYKVGQIAYWSPGNDVAIFYRDDGQRIPNPGIIILGSVDSGLDAFSGPGAINVVFESLSD